MANLGRKLGVNIMTSMQTSKVDLDSFAEQLGYSVKDVWNIIEGKVVIPPSDLERIASLLGTTKKDLIERESDSLIPDLQYMKEFSDPENLDKILDLMDEYVELREAI
ncbi:MAG: hypothetical protein IKO41_10500 [Lachnospiraceae bacterium]|nr:hypothetical protein [Lachnospiraceae bacterium]